MTFQTVVNLTQAPGVAGDFASLNPRHATLSMPGGFVAAAAGLTVGLFAWADTATGLILANTGTGVPTCFIHRNMQATNYVYLSNATMLIPGGQNVGDMFNSGDFWVKNAGAGAVTIGLKAFANLTTGVVTFAAAGATVAGAIETKWIAMSIAAAGELVKMSNTPLG
jgi:hypothetical protein